MASVVRTSFTSSDADSNVYAFNGRDVGANGGADTIYVMSGSRTIANASTATCIIDGVPAPLVEVSSFLESTNIRTTIIMFAVPRNDLPDPDQTDVDVTITWDQLCIRCGCAVHVSPDAQATAFDTAVATTTDDVSLDTPPNGIVIGGMFNGDTSAGEFTGLTEDGAAITIEGLATFITASDGDVAAETPRAVSVTTVAEFGAKLTASFAPQITVVEPGQVAIDGQEINLVELVTGVTAGQVAIEGQEVGVTNPLIPVVTGSVAVAGQTINLVTVGMGASPAIGAKSLLVDSGVGSETPTADWSIHVSKMPDGAGVNARAIAIFDTGGEENPDPKWLLDFKTIQVRVRAKSNEYADAYAKIAECKDRLLGMTSTLVGADNWDSVTALGDITFLGRDDNDRPELVMNFRIIMRPAAGILTNREEL